MLQAFSVYCASAKLPSMEVLLAVAKLAGTGMRQLRLSMTKGQEGESSMILQDKSISVCLPT